MGHSGDRRSISSTSARSRSSGERKKYSRLCFGSGSNKWKVTGVVAVLITYLTIRFIVGTFASVWNTDVLENQKSSAVDVLSEEEIEIDPMVVLGMHHSGTSILTRFLVSLGAWPGATEHLIIKKNNPLKFWERRDVIRANQALMGEAGVPKVGHRILPSWINWGYDPKRPPADSTYRAFSKYASAAIAGLRKRKSWFFSREASSPSLAWVMKDPRLCLTMSYWIPHIVGEDDGPSKTSTTTSKPVCVLIWRNPLLLAESMTRFAPSVGALSSAEWIAAWEAYETSAIRACRGFRKVFVSHEALMEKPWVSLQHIYESLRSHGVRSISMPSREVVRSIFSGVEVGIDENEERDAVISWMSPQLSSHAMSLVTFFEDRYSKRAPGMREPFPAEVEMEEEFIWPKLESYPHDVYVLFFLKPGEMYFGDLISQVSTLTMNDSSRKRRLVISNAAKASLTKTKFKNLAGWFDAGVDVVDVDFYDGDGCSSPLAAIVRTWRLCSTTYKQIMFLIPHEDGSVIMGSIGSLFSAFAESSELGTVFGVSSSSSSNGEGRGADLVTEETVSVVLVPSVEEGDILDIRDVGVFDSVDTTRRCGLPPLRKYFAAHFGENRLRVLRGPYFCTASQVRSRVPETVRVHADVFNPSGSAPKEGGVLSRIPFAVNGDEKCGALRDKRKSKECSAAPFAYSRRQNGPLLP